MNNKYYKRDDPNKQSHTSDDSMIIKAYVPPMLHARLRDQSRLQGLPMSRLVAIAIDNELDQEKPFHYDTTLPENHEDYAYVTEADKLLTYICRYPNGIGRDHLCLARHEFGVNDRSIVLAALAGLLATEQVEEVIPTKTKFKFWISTYRLIRAKDIHRKERKPRKFKKVEGKSTHYAKSIQDKDVES